MELNPRAAHRITRFQPTIRRFLTLGIPTSIQNPRPWALSTLARVGALKTCMALLLALNNNVLQTLMARWHHRDIVVFFEHDPSNTVADPLFGMWYFALIQSNRLTLMRSTTNAPMAPKAAPVRHPPWNFRKILLLFVNFEGSSFSDTRGSTASENWPALGFK